MNPEEQKKIKISDYNYILPDDRIAQQPLVQRDRSKLLVYGNGKVSHHTFSELPSLIPAETQLVVNDAKVIPARLYFRRSTGAVIEVFLLEPADSLMTPEQAMNRKQHTTWNCLVGNLKKWKEGETLSLSMQVDGLDLTLTADLLQRSQPKVQLAWNSDHTFGHILDAIGKIPLPPYIKRPAEEKDKETYQTVFAMHDGAVAAPTAGLHFTPAVLEALRKNSVSQTTLTLFVGAGTFAPVTVEYAPDHPMHSEVFSVSRASLVELRQAKRRVAVGTTSLRTLESLYWMGVKVLREEKDPHVMEKLYAYGFEKNPVSWADAIGALLHHMDKAGEEHFTGRTEIMIMPGYSFSSIDGLITNFHHPKTTLLMLIAAVVGDDWKTIYSEALENNYRFLSYGDSSLLWLNPPFA